MNQQTSTADLKALHRGLQTLQGLQLEKRYWNRIFASTHFPKFVKGGC
jgi:hypothetical protein